MMLPWSATQSGCAGRSAATSCGAVRTVVLSCLLAVVQGSHRSLSILRYAQRSLAKSLPSSLRRSHLG
jgi:hypothetical protein